MKETITDEQGRGQIDLMPFLDGYLVTRIYVRKEYRGNKVGRQMAAKMTQSADAEQVKLYLEINAYGDMDQAGLEAWYNRLGFSKEEITFENGETIPVYVRHPQADFPLWGFSVHDGTLLIVTRGRTQEEAARWAMRTPGLQRGETISYLGYLPIDSARLYSRNHAPGWLTRMPFWLVEEEARHDETSATFQAGNSTC